MFESFRPAGFVVIFLLIGLWIYFRLKNSGKKHGQHGRELWYRRLESRRSERLEGAATWEERRRRKTAVAPERKIAARFLKGFAQDDAGDAAGPGETREPERD